MKSFSMSTRNDHPTRVEWAKALTAALKFHSTMRFFPAWGIENAPTA